MRTRALFPLKRAVLLSARNYFIKFYIPFICLLLFGKHSKRKKAKFLKGKDKNKIKYINALEKKKQKQTNTSDFFNANF